MINKKYFTLYGLLTAIVFFIGYLGALEYISTHSKSDTLYLVATIIFTIGIMLGGTAIMYFSDETPKESKEVPQDNRQYIQSKPFSFSLTYMNIYRILSGILLVGFFLPWIDIASQMRLSAYDILIKDKEHSSLLFLIPLSVIIFLTISFLKTKSSNKLFAFISTGVVGLGVLGYAFFQMDTDNLVKAPMGYGFYLTVFTSIIIVFVGMYVWIKDNRNTVDKQIYVFSLEDVYRLLALAALFAFFLPWETFLIFSTNGYGIMKNASGILEYKAWLFLIPLFSIGYILLSWIPRWKKQGDFVFFFLGISELYFASRRLNPGKSLFIDTSNFTSYGVTITLYVGLLLVIISILKLFDFLGKHINKLDGQ